MRRRPERKAGRYILNEFLRFIRINIVYSQKLKKLNKSVRGRA